MNSVPVIYEYNKKYQSQVVDLILGIQQQEFHIPITKEDQPDLFVIESFYQTGRGNFWVAIFEDKVVGTISLLDIGENEVALRKMFVHKDFRGKQFETASYLLQNAINWGRKRGIKSIYLGTTPQFLAAHRFYEKNGFEEVKQEELPRNFPVLTVDKKFYRFDIKELI